MPAAPAAAATRHAVLRWSGAPLLVSGLALLIFALLATASSSLSWTAVPHALLGTGLGLAAFGANHDTALALAWRARSTAPQGQDPLPQALSDELDRELTEDRAGVMGLSPAPVVATLMPMVALLVQASLLWRLLS